MDVTMDPNLKCCVMGCQTRPNQGLRFYRFPCHNRQISSIWEQRVCQSANMDLNGHVCELHFDYRCKTGNECALQEGSLPTLHLPGFGALFSAVNAHFQISANRIEQPSYTISIDSLSYHCRFCLRRGLLYEVEASTYRSKSFSSLIDLPPNVLPNNTQPNACLCCLKSFVIARRLSMAVEHSSSMLQLLLQHPKQSKVVANTNYFDIKSELAVCNLILANSLSIKLEIEIEDDMVWANEDYDQKLVGTRGSTSPADKKSIRIVENQDNVSKMDDSVAPDEQCQKEFHKSFVIRGDYVTGLSDEGIPDASENSCVLTENSKDNAEVMVSNNSDDSCAEGRQFDNEQAPKFLNAVNNKTWQTTLTTKDKNTNICDWTDPSPNSFNVHMSKHVQNGKTLTIESQELVTLEINPVRNADGRYQCSDCPKAFVKKRNFGQHKRTHTNEGLYKCFECSKAFSNKTDFSRHMKTHTNERPYKCIECSKAFRNKTDLSRHKRTHSNEGHYKCIACSKAFSNKTDFSRHQRTHTNERPYKCSECPKTFSLQSNLHVHKRTHTNERPYKCIECSKAFRNKTDLSRHKRTHTNEGQYKCIECSKAFSNKTDFSRHKITHTNEKPYKCSECPKTFGLQGNLSVHKRIHTNEGHVNVPNA